MAGHSARIRVTPSNPPHHDSRPHDPTDRERRNGPTDRRQSTEDRRNIDRLSDDPAPRRNPDVSDRRLH